MASGISTPNWSAWLGGIRLANEIEVSFQRYIKPETETMFDVPPSLGALAVAEIGRNTFLLPLHDGEAFWISADRQQLPAWSFSMTVVLADDTTYDLLSSRPAAKTGGSEWWVPPIRMIAGLAADDGSIRPLFRSSDPASGAVRRLLVQSNGADRASHQATVAEFHTVDPFEFSTRTGLPAHDPPDPTHAYQGYRLP
jgi:hypothetical protein